MSKLYATLNSDSRRTQVTSRGHRLITSHIRGWDYGVRVECTDAGIHVWRTGGSNAPGKGELLATISAPTEVTDDTD